MTSLLVLVLAGGLTLAVPAPRVTASVSLDQVVVQLASRERLQVELRGAPVDPRGLAPLRTQQLLLADVPVPVVGAPAVQFLPTHTALTFQVELKAVPESALGIPFDRVPVRWEGRDEGGNLVLTVAGEIDPNDRQRLVVPAEELARTYARLEAPSLTPSLNELSFRALLRLYNPFAFDLVVTRFDYLVTVGSDPVMRAVRPGFRLRPGVASDVLLEESASLADVAAGLVGAVVGGKPVGIQGTIVLRAPTGEQVVPIRLVAGL